MKKISILLAFVAASVFAFGQNQAPAAESPASAAAITFSETSFDFGKVKEGETAVHSFTFTNTGTDPLVISRAQASCGCTVTDWTKTPVEPGKTGFVTASYNTNGRVGSFSKSVTVYNNSATPQVRLSFSGEVLPKAVPANDQSVVNQ